MKIKTNANLFLSAGSPTQKSTYIPRKTDRSRQRPILQSPITCSGAKQQKGSKIKSFLKGSPFGSDEVYPHNFPAYFLRKKKTNPQGKRKSKTGRNISNPQYPNLTPPSPPAKESALVRRCHRTERRKTLILHQKKGKKREGKKRAEGSHAQSFPAVKKSYRTHRNFATEAT